MESTHELLRMDVEGRVRTPAARREEIVDDFERSGMSAAAFAKAVGVKYPTLANWIQKRRQARRMTAEKEEPGGAALKWVEASVECPQARSALVVQLPGGASMAVNDAAQAALAGALLRSFISGGSAC
jgi:transposase-like protein